MEQKLLGLEAASWWTRGKAVIVDFLIFIAVLCIPAALIITSTIFAHDEYSDEFDFSGRSSIFLISGILSGVGALIWSGWLFGYRQGVTGTTPGKRRMGISLVDEESGNNPGGARGVGRWLVPVLVGSIPTFGNIVQVIDFLWPLWDPKKQRLIDKILKTRVIVQTTTELRNRPPDPSNPIS